MTYLGCRHELGETINLLERVTIRHYARLATLLVVVSLKVLRESCIQRSSTRKSDTPSLSRISFSNCPLNPGPLTTTGILYIFLHYFLST